jgi:phage-related protein (TIGR01555 family)
MKFIDSLVNLMSGLGTSRDKSSANQYLISEMSVEQIEAAYRGDWLPRKIINIPAQDCTREWRTWQAEADQISKIEEAENAFSLQGKIRSALIKARLYGGAGIVMGVDGAGDWSKPLDVERVREGSLKFLHVLDRWQLGIGTINQDIMSPDYGQPEYFTGPNSAIQIHPSRVVRFIGAERPSERMGTDGWGDSVLQAINDAVMQALVAPSALSTLMQEASIDIIKVPNFMDMIGTAEYRSRLIERFQLASAGKSIVRTLMLDANEEWQRHATNFSGLPEVVRTFLSIVAGAADIPVTRLLGESPGGLNATGDSDIRNYYDSVADIQKNDLQRRIAVLDEVLIRSALGDRDEEIHYTWNPLWQPTPHEKAEIRLKNTQSLMNVYNTGLIPPEALAKGAQNMLIEDGLLPGLEQAIEEADEIDFDESSQEAQSQFGAQNADPDEEEMPAEEVE